MRSEAAVKGHGLLSALAAFPASAREEQFSSTSDWKIAQCFNLLRGTMCETVGMNHSALVPGTETKGTATLRHNLRAHE